MESIEETVRAIVAKRVEKPIERVTLDSRLVKDLEVDSLDTVELVITLEETFNLVIPDIEAERMKTIRDIVRHLEKQLKARSENP